MRARLNGNNGNPRRVMLVCPVGEEIGGAEQVMLAIGRELPKYGFEPVLVSMRPGRLADLARSSGIEAHMFGRNHRYRDLRAVWQATRWLADLIGEKRVSLLHSTHTAHVYSNVASRRTSVPEIWHLHDTPSPYDPVDRLQRCLRPAHSISTTSHVAEAFVELRRRPHSVIAPTCIDYRKLQNQLPRPDVRQRLGLPEEGPMLLTVTRLQEHKGHPYLIDAAGIVLKERAGAVFVIVGKGSTPEQKQFEAGLVAQIARQGIGDRVRLVGFVDDADLAELYRTAFALVHPAVTEGYGLVLLESMSMGLPVIAAAAEGPKEIIQNGENGLLVPTSDPHALAQGIQRLFKDDVLRDRIRNGGSATAERLTLDQMMVQITNLYGTIAI